MHRMKIGIVNISIGNVGSVHSALRFYNYDVGLVNKPEELKNYTVLILAGVGHFKTAASRIKELHFWDALGEEVIGKKKPVLGICLGSQLIAEVLGAKVYKNLEKEIGWFDVMLTDQGKNVSFTNGMPAISKVFHWHGDAFDLPQNTVPVFFSEACKNQAFLYRDKVLGLQFHFEVTEQSIKAMIEKGKQELTSEKYIQTEKEIYSFNKYIESNNKLMFQILDHLSQ